MTRRIITLAASALALSSFGVAPLIAQATSEANQPAAEAVFLASKDAIEARFDNAPNDMVKHQIAGKWQNGGSCPAVKSARFTNWVGTIKTIRYDGKFEVDLGDNVLFHGSIDSASPLFQEVSALHEGDTVKVSGAFSMDQYGSECIAQASSDWLGNSDAGSVQSPIFDVLYSRVSAADSQSDTSAADTSSTPDPQAPGAVNDASQASVEFVKKYYDLWNARRYGEMYDMLGAEMQRKYPFETYKKYHDFVESISVDATPGASPMRVNIRITSVDRDEHGVVTTNVNEGTWTLSNEAGRLLLTSEDVHEVK